MLQKLILRNAQKHRRLKVEFDPELTVIIGNNDAGKTSILRALRWVCLNKPAGNELITRGEDYAKVKLITRDGTIIRRKGVNGPNAYWVDGHRYQAFGTNVPERVVQVLNVTETNFQNQLAPAFWFSLTPGQISKELNAIINLGQIDKTLSNISSRLRKCKAETQVTQDRLKAARRAKKELTWVGDAIRQLGRVERLAEKQAAISNSRAALALILEQAAIAQEQRERARQAEVGVQRLLTLATPFLQQRSQDLKRLVDETHQTFNRLVECEARLKLTERKLAKVKKCPLCQQPLK